MTVGSKVRVQGAYGTRFNTRRQMVGAQIFVSGPEAFELVRWKDVYDNLEAASDHGRHVARTVNHILVRHS
jgi:hypothetical protein